MLAKAEAEVIAMKCVEIITLRSLARADIESLDEFLRQISKSKIGFPDIRVYRHSMVETDFSIHIYWETNGQHPKGTAFGQQLIYGLKDLGLLTHSVWVEKSPQGFKEEL
ncbi:MAG: hypothetical protein C4576_07770 [Desulfobacteraceae bacterium]|nr:MAG: hypothetical protein C4576_07770 [Desulfobacteraceae bacterium]